MKIEQENREILSNIDGKTIDFKISGNAMIFDILRNKIYQDPIGSICREICDNARDAHRQSGVTRPIEIIVSDYLVVKDFGVGMSPDLIEHVYSSYGNSTKRDTNELSGGFGLGCKTPFAYTDQFIVITHHNGKRYEYCMFIDETSCGKIVLTSESDSTDVGTIVKIPIKPSDRTIFRDNIVKYTKYYPVSGDALPIIPGYTYPELKYEDYGFAITNPNRDSYHSATHVLVNGIPYQLDTYYFSSSVWGKFILKFGVGELELAASREKIQSTLNNKLKINEKIKQLSEMFHKEVAFGKGDFNEYLSKIIDYQSVFGGSTTEFDFEGNKFTYPLKQSVKQRHRGYPYGRTEWYNTNELIHLNNAVVVYCEDELTSSRKARISSYAESEGKKYCYVFPYEFFLEGVKYDDIKLKRQPSGGGGNYTGYTRLWNGNFFDSKDISQMQPFFFIEEGSKYDRYNIYSLQLDKPIYRIAKGKIKHAIANNHEPIDGFFEEIFSKFSIEDLKKYLSYKINKPIIDEYKDFFGFLETDFDFNYKPPNELTIFPENSSFLQEKIWEVEPNWTTSDIKIDFKYKKLYEDSYRNRYVKQLILENLKLEERVQALTQELEGAVYESALYAG